MAAPIAGRSVLLVEDDFLQAHTTASLLSDAGAEVLGPFARVCEAMQALTHRAIDCAVLDIDLGHGLDFKPLRWILARAVPVVLVTGYGKQILPPDLLHVPLVEKPYPVPVLIEEIARVSPGGT
jgi:CheY-like chemotaxis protein